MRKIFKLGNFLLVSGSLLMMIMLNSLFMVNKIIPTYILILGFSLGVISLLWGMKKINIYSKLKRSKLLHDEEKWICLIGILLSNYLLVLSLFMLSGNMPIEPIFIKVYFPLLIASFPIGIFLTLRSLYILES